MNKILERVTAIILAAGKGTRMKSPIPKVLHEVAGKPMVESVIECLEHSGVSDKILVLGGDLDFFSDLMHRHQEISVCLQENRKGTGDAVASSGVCFEGVETPSYSSRHLVRGGNIQTQYVIVCAGDTPAISSDVISEFIGFSIENDVDLSVLGMKIPDPTGYGRIITSSGNLLEKIVEHKDANDSELKIDLVNSGVIFGKVDTLFQCLQEISPSNSQNEYYLTDCFEIARKNDYKTLVYSTDDWEGFSGVNDPEQKSKVEQFMLSKTH